MHRFGKMAFLDNTPLLKRIVEVGYAMFIIIILSAIVGLILAFPVMWLWNYVFSNFPKVQINVFQAWALNVLTGILFGKSSGDRKR
jgi:ABC-type multidrug transport system fused ATPase/permease subunit